MKRTRRLGAAVGMPSGFVGFRFPPEVILLAVRWYLRYGLSYRDLEELLAERGIEVDHVTLYRWVQRFTPLLIHAARPVRHLAGDRWFVDETYVKVAGVWSYVYRAVDQHGQVIELRGTQGPIQRPHNSPKATQAEVVEKILWLRYHFGPGKISMYLQRYHQIKISPSGVWRILHRAGVNRLPSSQRYERRETRWKRYEKQRPGHQLQVDVKFIEPLGQKGRKKRYYQYTAIDDCTRLRVLRAYPRNDQPTAIAFIDHVLSKLPFAVARSRPTTARSSDPFHWHLLDKGVGHIRIRPRTPRLNGKMERSHRIDSEEFYRLLEGEVIDDARLFETRLQEWEDYYNYGALALRTPTTKGPGPTVIGLRQLHT